VEAELSVLDIARAPKALRDAVSPVLGLLPVSLKYGRGYQVWRTAIARSRDQVFTQEKRLAALRALLAKANAGSLFWQTRIAQAFGSRPDLERIHPDKFFDVSEFQFYQDTPGRCAIKVVPAADSGAADARLFLDEIQKNVGASVRFELDLVSELAGSARGKRYFIDQRLDLAQFGKAA